MSVQVHTLMSMFRRLKLSDLACPLVFLKRQHATCEMQDPPRTNPDYTRDTSKCNEGDNASEMSPGSSGESYPAFTIIGLRENPEKNLNQVTCPNHDLNPEPLVSRFRHANRYPTAVDCSLKVTDQEEKKELAGSLAEKKLPTEGCTEETISQEKKCHLKQHVQGAAHKAKAQQKNQLQQTLLTQPTSSNLSSNFYADLTRAFVAANIPWNAIENPVLRQFLQKYCKQNIPSESTLRKNYLDRIYNETLASIREDIGDSYIWVSVDETSDPMNRYIANMVVGKLSPNGPSIPHLVCVKELSKVNSQAIAYFVNKGLQSLYSGNIDDSKVLLFCTDAASYMVAAAPLLKTFYPNLTHVTCLAHGLHRVSETIRNEFPLVNSFISNTKKCFCKAPSRISIFRENFPDIPLPPQPVVTRWGTWIQSVVYYSKYFKEVVTVIDKLPETDSAACVKAVKDCLNDSRVKNHIAYITSNFSFIPASIEQLEREKQSLCSQIAIVKEAQVNIHSALGETGKKKRKIRVFYIKPPKPNFVSDENSADVEGGMFDNLSGRESSTEAGVIFVNSDRIGAPDDISFIEEEEVEESSVIERE
ncbi:hypothetical protein ANN_09773 [Periplaneta americana]|uniref:DUF659 domain-containing protein n=1 Tax=Periplaneta americana TaxID=6978 RepID=A0ABQ8TQV7_PERAM|nr:hypothetical protein ANN_09773 [Periplaneta americana]